MHHLATLEKGFEIRPYEDELRTELVTVWEQSVIYTHDFLIPSDFEEIKNIVNTIDFKTFPVFCLHHHQEIVGFVGVAENKVEMLFLSPAYFGRGLGKKLMHFAIEELGANEVDVNEQNKNAVSFYQKLGFEVYERSDKDGQGKNYPVLKMRLKPGHGN